jgi:hypothetical protein
LASFRERATFATASERGCVQAGSLFVLEKFMDTALLLNDAPADLPLIILFFGTIIFLAWLDYGNNKTKK